MKEFWQTTVEFMFDTDTEKPKKVREIYLVEGVSATDVEVKVYNKFEGSDFKITGVVKSKIIDII